MIHARFRWVVPSHGEGSDRLRYASWKPNPAPDNNFRWNVMSSKKSAREKGLHTACHYFERCVHECLKRAASGIALRRQDNPRHPKTCEVGETSQVRIMSTWVQSGMRGAGRLSRCCSNCTLTMKAKKPFALHGERLNGNYPNDMRQRGCVCILFPANDLASRFHQVFRREAEILEEFLCFA
jgi:hypothetical protein